MFKYLLDYALWISRRLSPEKYDKGVLAIHEQFINSLLSNMAAAERSIDMQQQDENKWAALQQLFAGMSAGIATTVCTHPLDLIKTRMQSIPSMHLRYNVQSIGITPLKWVE